MNGLARLFLFLSFALMTASFGGAYQRAITGNLMVLLAVLGVGTGLLAFLFGLMASVVRSRLGYVSLTSILSVIYGFGLLGAGAYGYVTYYQKFPRLNDVTTDMKNPPEFRGQYSSFEAAEGQELVKAKATRSYDMSFAPLQQAGYPDIQAKAYPHPPDVLFRAAVKTVATLPAWRISFSQPEKFHFEAEVESDTFHFIDDVAVEARPAANGQSELHIRSRSRAGEFDFGVNAARIRNFYAKVEPNIRRVLDADARKAAQGGAVATPPAASPAASPATPPAAAKAPGQ